MRNSKLNRINPDAIFFYLVKYINLHHIFYRFVYARNFIYIYTLFQLKNILLFTREKSFISNNLNFFEPQKYINTTSVNCKCMQSVRDHITNSITNISQKILRYRNGYVLFISIRE